MLLKYDRNFYSEKNFFELYDGDLRSWFGGFLGVFCLCCLMRKGGNKDMENLADLLKSFSFIFPKYKGKTPVFFGNDE